MKHFDSIIQHLKKIDAIHQISAVLSWDQETYMPKGSIDARAKQLETLAGIDHDYWQDPTLADDIHRFIDPKTKQPSADLSSEETAFIRELHATWRQHTALSKQLVQKLTTATTKAQHVWADARQKSDFSLFAPYLTELVDLTIEKANQLGFDDHPYDALIDLFEPGMNVRSLDNILMPLAQNTRDFLADYSEPTLSSIDGPFDAGAQRVYSDEIMAAMGYDMARGRLDISTHPFTIDIHPSDVRITTRINPNNLFESISSTIHEVGHGLYEQGLDTNWSFSPYGKSRSMGIHESQSRLWEIFIGQSLPFWAGQLPRLQSLFPSLDKNTPEDFYLTCKKVSPHWCRVESDIITYNLHIAIRYECEKALFSKTLAVKDLPEFWNQKMADYLGLTITDDAKGCLQDVHWSAGLFGYFPSYTLGTLIASELFKKLYVTFPNLSSMIEAGDFIPIKDWLNQNIHIHGCKMTTPELLSSLKIDYEPDKFLTQFTTMT
ncbi:MAG: carboxypeptidase M32 [Candidatus Marinamargulisbacteria bacterium]